jgi:membrane protein DedA with SNARE-associated domain
MPSIDSLIHQYGLLAVFLGTGLDHSGVPWVLVTAAFIASDGRLQILPLLLYASLAMVLFDHIYYFVGRIFTFSIRKKFTANSKWLNIYNHGEQLFHRHGGSLIIWGRYVPTVGRFTPLIAGMLGVSYRSFIGYTIVGTIVMLALFGYLTYVIGSPLLYYYRLADNGLKVCLVVTVVLVIVIVIWRRRKNADTSYRNI